MELAFLWDFFLKIFFSILHRDLIYTEETLNIILKKEFIKKKRVTASMTDVIQMYVESIEVTDFVFDLFYFIDCRIVVKRFIWLFSSPKKLASS